MEWWHVGVAAAVGVLAALPAAGDVLNTGALQDATIFQSATGSLANGSGDAMFVGRTRQGNVRRALVSFDVSSIPAGSVITDVSLQLWMAQTTSGPVDVSAFRLTSDWGEGPSVGDGVGGGMGSDAQTGDVTWLHTFFNTGLWATPGGDFAGAASATAEVDQAAYCIWSGAGMVADVQAWVDGTAGNFGWILIGNETTSGSAKRFGSSESFDSGAWPKLVVEYTPVPGPAGAGVFGVAGMVLARRRRRRG